MQRFTIQSCLLIRTPPVVLLFALIVVLVSGTALSAQLPQVATGTQGMVVTVSAPATQIGVEVLKKGGNAVDAAIAVAFALQVTWPEAGNIGGGGFMLVLPGPQQQPVCVEYRETAPQAATKNMFSLGETTLSCKAVGVPGTIRGMELAHQKFGRLPWEELVLPAADLARNGFPVDPGLARSLNDVLHQPQTRQFPEFLRTYGKPDGTNWQPGDILIQPDLAATLQLIAEKGPDAFYRGRIADQIVSQMQHCHGLITHKDLKDYQAHLRTPVHVRFRGYDIYGPPLPSSGGICLKEMLQTLKQFPLRDQPRWSSRNTHLQIETAKRVFRDRALYLGDSDFVSIPQFLTSPAHAEELAREIDPNSATPSQDLAPDLKIVDGESPSTTHFSIVDSRGMAVSNTYTLEHPFGSRIVVQGAGFLLNNEMSDFNWTPGRTDTRGRIGTKANQIAPGKRMLSSQTPVLVLKDGEVRLVTGSPGGRSIINTVLCVLLNVLEFEMPLPEAIAQPRLHHQWLPDVAVFEESAREQFPELLDQLRKMGHTISFRTTQGDAHSILRSPASNVDDKPTFRLQGVADQRRSGSAQGY